MGVCAKESAHQFRGLSYKGAPLAEKGDINSPDNKQDQNAHPSPPRLTNRMLAAPNLRRRNDNRLRRATPNTNRLRLQFLLHLTRLQISSIHLHPISRLAYKYVESLAF